MRRATGAGLAIVCVWLAGCAAPAPEAPRTFPPGDPLGWDVPAPEESSLASEGFYTLTHSSTFLAKNTSYARYVIRVDRDIPAASIFFTSTNDHVPGLRRPNVSSPEYHYEFMQLRRLGQTVQVMDVNADPAFSQGNTGRTFTLAFIYGRGAFHQYLAPYEGNPARWPLDAGYYELLIATDEKLTVGINIRIGTPTWKTYYDPQELGRSRAEALDHLTRSWFGAAPRTFRHELESWVSAYHGETLNYFVFSDLIYRANAATVDARGIVSVFSGARTLPHRLQITGVYPDTYHQQEAFAYAVSFGEEGPVTKKLGARLELTEYASVDSDVGAYMLLFAVALKPERTTDGTPTASAA